jgi:hypothetical protein
MHDTTEDYVECQIDLWRGIVPPSQVPKLKWPVLWYIRQNPPLQAKKACVLVVIPPPLQMSHLKPQTSNLNESEWVREHYTNSIKLLLLHAANPDEHNNNKKTPLDLALNDTELINLLRFYKEWKMENGK